MIVSFNFYYARPGAADAVLRQRLRASDVRQELGIARGRVLARVDGSAELPDVVWEHSFDEIAGHHADMAVRAASPAFEAVRAGMRRMYRRFERPLFEVSWRAQPAAAAAAPAAGVTLDWFFCAAANTADALALLARHVESTGKGGRLLRLITPGNDLPELIWQRDCAVAAGAEHERGWPPEVAALAPRVEHSAWRVA